MAIQPLRKTSWHQRAEDADQRRKAKAADTRAKRFIERQVEEAERKAAYDRDGGKCRATGKWLPFKHSSPLQCAHSHHMKYRSAGGGGEISNRVTLSFRSHRMEHDGYLRIDGDPNGTLIFTEINPETGKEVRQWQSTV